MTEELARSDEEGVARVGDTVQITAEGRYRTRMGTIVWINFDLPRDNYGRWIERNPARDVYVVMLARGGKHLKCTRSAFRVVRSRSVAKEHAA